MGTNYYFVVDEEQHHIGKSSAGWRFMWAWTPIFELMKVFGVKVMLKAFPSGQVIDHTDVIVSWINDMNELPIHGDIDFPCLTEKIFLDAFSELARHTNIVDEYGCESSLDEFLKMVHDKQPEMTSSIYCFSPLDQIGSGELKELITDHHFLPRRYLLNRKNSSRHAQYRIGGFVGSLFHFS